MQLEQHHASLQLQLWILSSLLLGWKFSWEISHVLYWNMLSYFKLDWNNTLDPFIETKKKCLPDNPDNLPFDERWTIDSEVVHYLVNPLTIEKRDGPSFADAQMNNLIVDKDDTLLQLVDSHTIWAPIFPGLRLMKTTEYTNGEWRVVARKFEQYI